MKNTLKWYFETWWKIMARPIYFYTFMEKGPVGDRSFTFMIISSWVLATGATIAAYVISIYAMLSVLVAGITGVKFLIVLPVFILLSVMFFLMILLIVVSVVVVGTVAMFAAAAAVLHYFALRLGGEGSIKEMIKASYYSTSIYWIAFLLPVLACAVKFRLLSFQNFMVGMNIVIAMIIIYLWGLWSIAVKKVYKITRSKAVLSSLIMTILMLLLQMFAALKIMPLLERWIA